MISSLHILHRLRNLRCFARNMCARNSDMVLPPCPLQVRSKPRLTSSSNMGQGNLRSERSTAIGRFLFFELVIEFTSDAIGLGLAGLIKLEGSARALEKSEYESSA
jgi:hypothetical protein